MRMRLFSCGGRERMRLFTQRIKFYRLMRQYSYGVEDEVIHSEDEVIHWRMRSFTQRMRSFNRG